MTITIESGIITATNMALRDSLLYDTARNKFHSFIIPYISDAPIGMAIGHLLWFNRALLATPTPSKDRRRGFMYATATMARQAGIPWEELDDVLTCGYVWGRDINSDSLSIYTTNSDLFSVPGEDFWRCAYLKHILGDTNFATIWRQRLVSAPTVYAGLVYAVNIRKKGLPGWPIIKLKRQVLVGCEYVFQIGKRAGTMVTGGYGIQPVMNRNDINQVII